MWENGILCFGGQADLSYSAHTRFHANVLHWIHGKISENLTEKSTESFCTLNVFSGNSWHLLHEKMVFFRDEREHGSSRGVSLEAGRNMN